MVRFRVFFDDHHLLNNSQLSNGLGRYWLLLKPTIATFADLASHLREMFALRDPLVLCIGSFVLPPFESTCIIKDGDIIRVKQKNVKLKDICKPCDSEDLVQDSPMARAHNLSFNNCINVGEKSQENSQGDVTIENAASENSLSLVILLPKQKRERLIKLQNSIKKRQKYNCTEKQVTSVDVRGIHSRQHKSLRDVSGDSKMELHAENNGRDNGLVVVESGAELNLSEQVPLFHMPYKGRQQSEEINKGLESELHTLCGVSKEYSQLSCVTSKMDQNQVAKMSFKEKGDLDFHERKSSGICIASAPWLDRKSEGDSSVKEVKTDVIRTDFTSLFPLIRSPMKGDVLAYRYVEPSSTVYPELSSPQVGKVSAFDNKTSVIVLVKAPEFVVFLEENPKTPMSPPRSLLYKDGSLEIKLSALVDVRLLKAHESKELACLPEGTLNRIKDSWKVGNWKSHRTGRDNGAKDSTNERRASSSWIYGASPAEAFFWETVLSRGAFGKGGKCSGSGKY